MATTAVEVVTLAQLKDQLGEDGAEHDTLFTRLLRDAVAQVQREAGMPVLARTETYRLEPRRDPDRPLGLARTYITAVTAITGWAAGTAFREAADVDVDVATLGRTGYVDTDHERPELYAIWPPADGWPTVAVDSQLQVSVTRGMTDAQLPEVVPAVVQLVREAWDLEEDPKGSERLIRRLIRPRLNLGGIDASDRLPMQG